MTSRAFVRQVLTCLFLAAACDTQGGTGPNDPPQLQIGSGGSVPLEAPFTPAATFTDSTGGPFTYRIDWGDGTQTTGTKATDGALDEAHAYTSQSTFQVKITVTDRRGLSDSGAMNVTVTHPVLLAAGDIGDCQRSGDEQTATLLDGLRGIVVPLGDNAYDAGTDAEYAACYAANWGRHKARTRPVAGNHDYDTPGATGYFNYFGASAGNRADGFYTYPLGTWFVIVANTGWESPDSVKTGSRQDQWLRGQLASRTEQCVLVMMHHPRFTSASGRAWLRPELKPFWDAMYEYGVDLVLVGHDHTYQRFAPQNPDGVADEEFGIRQITVGTGGGETLYAFGPTVDNLQVRDNQTFGVVKVTLRPGAYDWQFLPVAGKTFTDSGSGNCHGRPM
jgi:hypothetical protein